MNSKIIVIIIAAILVVAGVGAYFLLQDKDKEINILAGVNTEGSGIYIDDKYDVGDMFDAAGQPIPSGWEGKVFGTPGISTIQHVQILQIVEGMGMGFAAYTIGGNNYAEGTVYFIANIPNAAAALNDDYIDGGILWQPQYQKIVEDKTQKRDFKELALTSDLFPGHACCVIAGYHGYTSTHEDETVRFLAAYIKAVDWVNGALADKGGDDYALLVSVAKDRTGSTFTDSEIEAALDTVIYTYGQNSGTPLAYLMDQIPALAEDLVALEATKKTLADSGFSSGAEFADRFIDDSFLVKALQLLASGGTYENKASLKVAVIAGDVHQIAIHMADELGYFGEYGLDVSFSNATNGPGVATAIQNGEASFGLLGAPPITITVINGELVKAQQDE